MNQDQLFFETLKLDRGWYFVEYSPPISSSPFATIQLVVPGAAEATRVAQAMENELASWLRRYPVPVMVSAFDGAGSLIALGRARDCNHLIGWQDAVSGKPLMHWRMVANDEFPRRSWDPQSLRSIYADIPFRTSAQLRESAQKQQRTLRFGWWLVFMWAVAIPVGIALLGFNAPEWLAVLMFLYSLSRAYVEAMKLLGRWPKTDGELATEDEERRMRHHHYHCERNPEGFQRLKLENFERENREAIRREAAGLKAKGRDEAG